MSLGPYSVYFTPNYYYPTVDLKYSHKYKPSPVEQYVMDNMVSMGWEKERPMPSVCNVWKNKSSVIYNDLHTYLDELNQYNENIEAFEGIRKDLRKIILQDTNKTKDVICSSLQLDPGGLSNMFPSKQLSLTARSGYIEPLLPPMRHPQFCLAGNNAMKIDYLVHDFERMCRNLKPHTKTVFIDLGASLAFHKNVKKPPAIALIDLYNKFGFKFDHIYAFEVTQFNANEVFEELLPMEHMSSYHWINTGVTSEIGNKLNPWDSILRKFDEDDFVVIKLDIDTSSIEVPLAQQLLKDESLHKLVDQFYFEHHVYMKEISRAWGNSMQGSMNDTFNLFHGLRQVGVPAHFWV